MEELKKLEDINKPDDRNQFYSITNQDTGESRVFDISDLYASIEAIELTDKTPDDVISQFNVARNLAIYSWHSFSFNQVSEFKAYSCVEMALRKRLGRQRDGLRKLIKRAVNLSLITDNGFGFLSDSDSCGNEYSESLKDIVPELRNNLAHGSTTLHPGAITTLQWCADLINQLYENSSDISCQQATREMRAHLD